MNRPLDPIPDTRFDQPAARHLLDRAGFGGTPRQVRDLAGLGVAAAVDHLVDYERIDDAHVSTFDADPDILPALTDAERQALRRAREAEDEATLSHYRAIRNRARRDDAQQLSAMRQWWLARMVETPRPLEEKLTLLWHDHFATSHRGCRDSFLLYQQNRMFRRHASGSFADLALGIIRDPAMIMYLNNDRNRKQRPNENLARELMELFTLSEGQYTERDIREGARALTGYFRDDDDFVFQRYAHDGGTKTILGVEDNHDGESFVMTLLRRRACSEFIAWKLYRHFVADVTDFDDLSDAQRSVIIEMARQMRASDYRIKPVLKTLFRSEHFYDPAVRGTKIKSPVHLTVNLVRVLRPPARDFGVLVEAMRAMGQDLFAPPNVAGWPGGRAWINTATLFIRQNLATYLITGRPPFKANAPPPDDRYDPTRLIAELDAPTPEAVVDHLLDMLLGAARNDARRAQLLRFLADHDNHVGRDTLIALLCLITAMPEYQLT